MKHLRELMTLLGVSQHELANRSGVSQPTISAILRGKQEPKWFTVCALADGLGVSLEALRGRSPTVEQSSEHNALGALLSEKTALLLERQELLERHEEQLIRREELLRERELLFDEMMSLREQEQQLSLDLEDAYLDVLIDESPPNEVLQIAPPAEQNKLANRVTLLLESLPDATFGEDRFIYVDHPLKASSED